MSFGSGMPSTLGEVSIRRLIRHHRTPSRGIQVSGPQQSTSTSRAQLIAAWLVELPFPVVRHLPRRPGGRLAERVVLRWGERRTVSDLVRAVVVVPALAGFEARDDPMTRLPGVSTRMLPRRGIATPDVAALGTAP